MNGDSPDSQNEFIHRVLWPDAEIEGIRVSYESIDIALTESTGQKMRVICSGHIGFRVIGFWDEVVIERAEATLTDPLIRECLQSLEARFGSRLHDTGSLDRNAREWALLRITLGDAAKIEVVASKFFVASGWEAM